MRWKLNITKAMYKKFEAKARENNDKPKEWAMKVLCGNAFRKGEKK